MSCQRKPYRLLELFALTFAAAVFCTFLQMLDATPAIGTAVAVLVCAVWLRDVLRSVPISAADQEGLRAQVAAWLREQNAG